MKTLYDDLRFQQKRETWNFSKEIDMFFKKDKDIHHQINEVLKVTLYFNKLFSDDEIIELFPKILRSLNFPEVCFPSNRWIKTEIQYIRKLKRLGLHLRWK